jgi:carbon storage regulator CsrA
LWTEKKKEWAMLILSRKKDQSVIVGGDLVVVTVVAIEVQTVRLGFKAGRSISVNRKEVQDRIDGRLPRRLPVGGAPVTLPRPAQEETS